MRRLTAALKDHDGELRDHERRLTRLEAKWETAIELAQIATGRQDAGRLAGAGKR